MNTNIRIEVSNPSLATYLATFFERRDVNDAITKIRNTHLKGNVCKSQNEWNRLNKGKIFTPFDKDLSNSLDELKIPPILSKAFKQAVIFGKITSFIRAKPILIPNDLLKAILAIEGDTQIDGDYSYALLSPVEATEPELIKAFRLLKKSVRESKKTSQSNLDGSLLLQPNTDTISNILRDARWYHEHSAGKSYEDIAMEEKLSFDKETVKKAIKRYEKKIILAQ